MEHEKFPCFFIFQKCHVYFCELPYMIFQYLPISIIYKYFVLVIYISGMLVNTSCKAPRLIFISTSSTTTKTFFDIMHCLISLRYSSTSSSLCIFLSHKYCRSFSFTSLMSFDFTSFKKLDFSYWYGTSDTFFHPKWSSQSHPFQPMQQ